jgi:putative ABC transport system permease protein
VGGVIGMGIASLLGLAVASTGQFPLSVDYRVWVAGAFAILGLAIAVGLQPALRARRLKIVDALADR